MNHPAEAPDLYPCVFPIKVIGECNAEFEADVLSVMKAFVEGLSEETIGRRTSSGGKYLSLTIHIVAESREHVEKIYAELRAQNRVIMVL